MRLLVSKPISFVFCDKALNNNNVKEATFWRASLTTVSRRKKKLIQKSINHQSLLSTLRILRRHGLTQLDN